MSNLNLLQKSTNKLLNHYCNSTIYADNNLTGYLKDIIEQNINDSYKFLSSKNDDKLKMTSIEFKDIIFSNIYLDKFIQNIKHICDTKFKDVIDGIYFYGSQGDYFTINGWSDIDSIIVLQPDIAGKINLKKIEGFTKWFYKESCKISSLQHHGPLLLFPFDLKNFYFLPKSTIIKAKRVWGTKTLSINFIDTHKFTQQNLISALNYIIQIRDDGVMMTHAYKEEYLHDDYRNYDNAMYQLKYYLGLFLNLPVLYLNTKSGIGVDKGDSFKEIINVFPEKTNLWLNKLSLIRVMWGIKEGFYYEPNEIPLWLREILGSNYFEQGAEVAIELKNFFTYR